MTEKQPKGMYVLAFTETFERLSYYTLAFLLVLYASAPMDQGGLGWSKANALALVSVYSMAAYSLPMLGALIADRILGRYRAVLLGGCAIVVGHICMLFSGQSTIALYGALTLVACGTAFFKPCMPALLGQLYRINDTRRGAGFNWYYAGINLGGFIAGISGGLLMQQYGYHVALGSAGVGMLIGLSVFFLGRHHLVLDAVDAQEKPSEMDAREITRLEHKAVYVLLIGMAFFSLWAVCYNLALSGTLSLYIENDTQRMIGSFEIPTTFFSSLNALVIIIGAPLLSVLLVYIARKWHYPHAFSQMAFGLVVLAIAMVYLVYLVYLVHIGESAHGTEKAFHWTQIALFLVIYTCSEILISPAMMSAASIIAPFRFKSTFQGICLLCLGVTALLAGKLGVLSLKEPFQVFSTVAVVVTLAAILYFFIKGWMISVTQRAVEAAKPTVAAA